MSQVLLVDDNEHLLTVAAKFLTREELFFEMVATKSAKDALQILTRALPQSERGRFSSMMLLRLLSEL